MFLHGGFFIAFDKYQSHIGITMDTKKLKELAGIIPRPTELEKLHEAAESNKSDNSYRTNIEKDSEKNTNFRKVLHTTEKSQLVLMSLKPNEEIGMEAHNNGDQFIRVESGTGKSILDGKEQDFNTGDVVVVGQGTEHNIINTSDTDKMQLYVVYSPPQHEDGTIDKSKPAED